MSLPEPAPFPYPALCLVTDASYCPPGALLAVVAQTLEAGVNMVQLRERQLAGGLLLALALELREVTRGRALLLVNERVDVALASGADGVELGEEAMPVEAARRVGGRGLLLGRSVHNVEAAREAQARGADFLIVGTIFPTSSKPGASPAGLALLADVARAVTIPFLAIGGVNRRNVAQVMEKGCAGAAVISAILAAPDPREAARGLMESMRAAVGRRVPLSGC